MTSTSSDNGSMWERHDFRTSDGLVLATYEAGPTHAPKVVFVHGYPDHHSLWDLVAAELVDHFHLIAYDGRGAGASEVPADLSGWRLARLLEDLDMVIRQAAGGGPVHLVGHDWGSIQGWAFVLHPEYRSQVASFTSLSGPALQHVERRIRAWIKAGPRGWKPALRQSLSSTYISFFQTPLAPVLWRKVLGPRWPRLMARQGAYCDARWPGPGVGEDAAHGVGLYRAQRRALLPPFRTDRLPPARVPTDVPVRLMVAVDDQPVGKALLEGLDQFSTATERQELTGGHWLARTRPVEVANAIRRQIEAHS